MRKIPPNIVKGFNSCGLMHFQQLFLNDIAQGRTAVGPGGFNLHLRYILSFSLKEQVKTLSKMIRPNADDQTNIKTKSQNKIGKNAPNRGETTSNLIEV